MAQSDSAVLFEPNENCQLRCLDIGEGLLEIQPQSDPCVSIPIRNSIVGDVTLPRGTVIEHYNGLREY